MTTTPEQTEALSKLASGTHVLVPVEPTYKILGASADWQNYKPPHGHSPIGKKRFGQYCAMVQSSQEDG